MRRERVGAFMMAMAVISCPAGLVVAGESTDGRSPWSQVLYDADGRLLSASGMEKPGVPLELSTEAGMLGSRFVMRTHYRRGEDELRIEKIYEGSYKMDVIYTAGEERLVASLTLDDVVGETLVVYRLPNGRVFPLRVSEDGELLSGDLHGLRRALKGRMQIARLMRSLVENGQALESALPSSAARLIMLEIYCEHACADGCAQQCSTECSLFGPAGCQLCQTACRVGCAIGCWN